MTDKPEIKSAKVDKVEHMVGEFTIVAVAALATGGIAWLWTTDWRYGLTGLVAFLLFLCVDGARIKNEKLAAKYKIGTVLHRD
jgi:hypothetical protein